jgi:hypothetical protein
MSTSGDNNLTALNHLRFHFGVATQHEACVVVDGPSATADWLTTATLRGPFSRTARTLPAAFRLRGGESPTEFSCSVVDPALWAPELPAYYELSSATDDRRLRLGFRRWESLRGHWYLNGRRRVLRAVRMETTAEISWQTCSDTATTLWVAWPTAAFCEAAMLAGVPVIGDFRPASGLAPVAEEGDASPQELLPRRIAELARFPNLLVSIVYARQLAELGSHPHLPVGRKLVGRTMFALPVDDVQQLASPIPMLEREGPGQLGCSAIVCDESTLTAAGKAGIPLPPKPVMAVRTGSASRLDTALATRRSGCDQLQRDLAPSCDLAGYLIGL